MKTGGLVSAHSQGFTLGYFRIAPTGRDIFIALHSQGFTLGYFHIAPTGQDIFIALRSQGFTLGYFHIAPPGQVISTAFVPRIALCSIRGYYPPLPTGGIAVQ